MPFVVELEQEVWLSPEFGDPGRTLVIDKAKLFRTLGSAKVGLFKAREYRPFADAKIIPVKVRVARL